MAALSALRSSETLRPLARPVFAALWFAVLLSNIGNWMETVGAQWLLVSTPGNSTLVALVQTADTLPVVLLALPAGALADVFDRRLLLIGTQVFLAVNEVILTWFTATGLITPGLLLILTFLGGAGAAVSAPAWQALVPDIVDRGELRAAALLSSVSINVARAVGPALAGVLIAIAGVAVLFGINTATFVIFALVLVWAKIPRSATALPRERFLPAMRAGSSYVRWSPYTRTVLVRAALFLLPATATWALLPLIAQNELGLDATGYGVLLGALGVGAIVGVGVLGRVHERYSDEAIVRVASVGYALTMAALVLLPDFGLAIATLLIAGLCWVAVLSTVNATLQLFIPGWVRARGLGIYLIVLYGGQAAGAVVWGVVAGWSNLTVAFVSAAVVMIAGAVLALRWPLRDVKGIDRSPAPISVEPQLAFQPDPGIGPVLVRVDYHVPEANVPAFVEAMEAVERSRRQTGASQWQLFRDGEDPSTFVELFELPSWDEHLRQHGGRLTGFDAAVEARADALADRPSRAYHYFPADVDVTSPAEHGRAG